MNLKNFKRNDWVQIWEGGWSFLSSSHFGDQYTKELRFGRNPVVSQTAIFSAQGRGNAWIAQADRDRLGKYLVSQFKKDPRQIGKVCSNLKRQGDNIIPFMKKLMRQRISSDQYQEFWQRISLYYWPHIYVKYIVDYLDARQLEKWLRKLEDARVYVEPVFKHSEEVVYRFADVVAAESGYEQKLILCLRKNELYDYFGGAELPERSILKQRNKKSCLIFDENSSAVCMGEDYLKLEKLVKSRRATSELRGTTAYPGKIRGLAKIVNDPREGAKLKVGDILISGMTRPELLPVMERASGFVTDSGGILCHAAIVAREMKKPCVIGTQIATKFLKDGDMIEVDATKAIVRKI
jgi:phosphohistidine swiveling domain-containing protein